MNVHENKVFGLTGGSGAGKSQAAVYMEKCGFGMIDADLIAREVTRSGTQCLDELAEHFGEGILLDNGELNRKKLGDIVFHDEAKLKTLNKITHHYIKHSIKRRLADMDAEFVGINGAVIIGGEVEQICKFIVVVDADYDIRLKRIIARDNLSEEKCRARLNSQPDSAFYREHADYVIENNTGCEELEKRVQEICEKIKAER